MPVSHHPHGGLWDRQAVDRGADQSDNNAKYNRGYRYLFTVDVFSWVQPVKNKTAQAMMDAFEKNFKGGRQLINHQTDDGKEFYNKTFQALKKLKGIHHFSTSADTKASVVEQYNQTLKQRLY